MASEPNDNETKQSWWDESKGWCSHRLDEGKLIAKTAIALIFIVNSMALGLLALDLVKPSQDQASVFGTISITFAAVILGTFVHQGVKFQTTNKRKR